MQRVRPELMLIVVAACVTGCAEPDPHAKEKLRIDFPAEWEVVNNLEGAQVVGLSPQQSARGGFRENVNVLIEKLPRSMSLETYMKAVKSKLESGFTDFELIEEGSDQLGDHKAGRLVYQHAAGRVQLKALAYVVIHGRRAVTITATARSEEFDLQQSKFETVAKTVRFEKPPELKQATETQG